MALSDYDILAFDTSGKPCTGLFKGNQDMTFEVRKTFLNAWAGEYDPQKGGDLFVTEGDVSYRGNSIKVKRAESCNAILVFITADTYFPQDEVTKKYPKPVQTQFAAIGAYGWDHNRGRAEWFKQANLDPAKWEIFSTGSYHHDGRRDLVCDFQNKRSKKLREVLVPESAEFKRKVEPRYTGVTAALRRELFAFIQSHISEYDKERQAWLDSIKKAKGLRYNAGDAYFAANGVGELGGTEIGKPTVPLVMQMLKS